jgi:hypothetical protein
MVAGGVFQLDVAGQQLAAKCLGQRVTRRRE